MDTKEETANKETTILATVDFSPCSLLGLRKANSMSGKEPTRIVVLHVIDRDFVERCVRHHLGTEKDIRKRMFLRAEERLHAVLRKEGMDGEGVEGIVCEGTPYLEINKKAVELDADMVVMGCTGNSEDMENIFFGSTTERVLRFIKRPVFCVPENEGYKLD
jgi:nucleotide-binding universal stress UspA family protein